MTTPTSSSSPYHRRPTLRARLVRTGLLLVPTVLTVFLLPFSLHAQRAYAGAVGGRTSTELPDQIFHHGTMAGLFFQVDLSEHTWHFGPKPVGSWGLIRFWERGSLARCSLE